MAGRWNTVDLRRQDSVSSAVLPTISRQADSEARTIADATPKVKALLNYMRLSDALHQAMCLPQPGTSLTSLQHLGASSKHIGKRRSEQHHRTAKLAQLEAISRELEALSITEVMDRLRSVFEAYCSKKRCVACGRWEMDCQGFLRLLRDCHILDNKLTIVQAESVFCGPRAPRGDGLGFASASPRQEVYVDFDGFLGKLKRVLRTKSPPPASSSAVLALPPPRLSLSGGGVPIRKSMSGSYNMMPPPLSEDPQLAQVAKTQILVHHKAKAEVQPVDVLYTPELLDMVREHDAQLRHIFVTFASLDDSDPQRALWDSVRASGTTIGRTEFMLVLLNYQIIPVLLAKHEALEVLTGHRSTDLKVSADPSKKDPLSQPSFCEMLAAIAIYIADNAISHIETSMASPDDMRRMQRYIACCEGPLQEQLQQAMQDAAQQWSAKTSKAADARRLANAAQSLTASADLESSGLGRSNRMPPWMYSTSDDAQLIDMKQRAWQKANEEAVNARLAVVARREDTRMKHALKRLHNSYRDVRTVTNNGTWPLNASSVTGAGTAGTLPLPFPITTAAIPAAHNGTPGALDTRPNSVAFFSNSLQIKTPKPLSMSAPGPVQLQLPPWEQMPSPTGLSGSHPGALGTVPEHWGAEDQESGPQSALSEPGWSAKRMQSEDAAASPPHYAPSVFHSSPSPFSAAAEGGWRAQQKADALGAIRSRHKGDALQFISSQLAAAPPTSDSLQQFVAGYGFVPLPTPQADLEPIEARDEFELMHQVASRLPALKL